MARIATPDPKAQVVWNVYVWRRLQLERSGWPMKFAMTVADSEVDLHEACKLVERGCPPELALRILL